MIEIGTYCTSSAVASIIGTSAFSSSTTPTDKTVELMIQRAEERIDDTTTNSWRSRVSYQELHHLELPYIFGSGIPVYLDKMNLKTLATGSGDILEVWNGSTWENWTTSKTESRNRDYWLDYRSGILYLVTRYTWRRDSMVRITYRYGANRETQINATGGITADATTITVDSTAEFDPTGYFRIDDEYITYTGKTSTTFTGCTRAAFNSTAATHTDDAYVRWIPLDIEEACTKMVAIELLRMDDRAMVILEGGDKVPIQDKIRMIQEDVDRILHRRANAMAMTK